MRPWGGVSGMGGHRIPGMPSQPVGLYLWELSLGLGTLGPCCGLVTRPLDPGWDEHCLQSPVAWVLPWGFPSDFSCPGK